jgi:macrolide transport system ATP-binding/permease protein
VLHLLGELWKDGRTILLVTHDAEIAAHAQRILVMHDGNLEADGGAGEPTEPASASAQPGDGAYVHG